MLKWFIHSIWSQPSPSYSLVDATLIKNIDDVIFKTEDENLLKAIRAYRTLVIFMKEEHYLSELGRSDKRYLYNVCVSYHGIYKKNLEQIQALQVVLINHPEMQSYKTKIEQQTKIYLGYLSVSMVDMIKAWASVADESATPLDALDALRHI